MQAIDVIERLARVDIDLVESRVEAFFNARRRGDFDELKSFLAPTVKFECMVPKGLGGSSTRGEGRKAFLESIRGNHMAYEWIEHKILDVITDGGRAVVRRVSLSRHRGSGSSIRLNCFSMVEFRDGLIVSWVEYVDTVALAKLLGGD